ncbi:MAG: ABC transporter ATP-binding protein [Planctomycetota bacterium]
MPDALAIEKLRYRYSGRDDFSLAIDRLSLAAGDDLLLVGKSGEGKSTLLHLIAGLLDPDAGEVRVAGRALHRLRGSERDRYRAANIGMIFQTHHLMHGFTALENVMTALAFSSVPKKEHEPRSRKLLARLGIERGGATPDRLSVGQQQRVAIARALVCEPAIVLADEPTASLDPERALEVIDLLRSVCSERNASLLCVSHDPSMVDRFGRVERLSELCEDTASAAT